MMMEQTVFNFVIINYYCFSCCYELFLMTALKNICYTVYRARKCFGLHAVFYSVVYWVA